MSNGDIDIKETELIDVSSKKEEKIPFKAIENNIKDLSTSLTTTSSYENNNTLSVNGNSLTKEIIEKKINYRKGNMLMFFFDDKAVPKIVIGPNCKNFFNYLKRFFSNLFTFFCCFFNFAFLYRFKKYITSSNKIFRHINIF